MSEKHASWKNYQDYLGRKDKLKNGILQHPEEGKSNNSIYDFMQKSVSHNMWAVPYKEFHSRINKIKRD